VIPIWAIFESLTLGEFGTFFACSNSNVKLKTSSILHLPSNIDTDGKITEYIIYAIKDLRNAIAHNNTIFDARFQTSTINNRLVFLLETEVGITGLDFKYIYAYIVLITYVLRKMGDTKTSCKHFITEFIFISWPYELSIFKTFIQKNKSVTFPVQDFHFCAAPSTKEKQ
jgi:abortive infection bacteriophage resistance protein